MATVSLFFLLLISMASVPLIPATDKKLDGKVAIITGAASGLGAATARLFSKHGATVIIADIQDELGNAVAKELESPATFIHCDVTNEDDVENAINTTISKYGKLDIMINNAGTSDVIKPNILDNEKSEFEKVIDVNLIGAFLGTKHAARVMIPSKRGVIINTASVAGVIGGGTSHAYTSSKHALIGLMKNTAVELGKYGIRVNCVSPYMIYTPLVRDKFNLTKEGVREFYTNLKGTQLVPNDVAEANLYLASDESKYVSGHNLVIDGGVTAGNGGFTTFGQSK